MYYTFFYTNCKSFYTFFIFCYTKKLVKKVYFTNIKKIYLVNEKMSRYRSRFIWTKEKDWEWKFVQDTSNGLKKTTLLSNEGFHTINQEYEPENQDLWYVKTTISFHWSNPLAIADHLHAFRNFLEAKPLQSEKAQWIEKWTELEKEITKDWSTKSLRIWESKHYSFIWWFYLYDLPLWNVSFDFCYRIKHWKLSFEELKKKADEIRNNWTFYYPDLQNLLYKHKTSWYEDALEVQEYLNNNYEMTLDGTEIKLQKKQEKKSNYRLRILWIALFLLFIISRF